MQNDCLFRSYCWRHFFLPPNRFRMFVILHVFAGFETASKPNETAKKINGKKCGIWNGEKNWKQRKSSQPAIIILLFRISSHKFAQVSIQVYICIYIYIHTIIYTHIYIYIYYSAVASVIQPGASSGPARLLGDAPDVWELEIDSHLLHGAGRFAHKTGWFLRKCWYCKYSWSIWDRIVCRCFFVFLVRWPDNQWKLLGTMLINFGSIYNATEVLFLINLFQTLSANAANISSCFPVQPIHFGRFLQFGHVAYCICMYMNMHVHTCIHAYMHTCIHAYMHTCIHAYMHTCIHAYMHTCIHAYMHTCIHAYIHTYIHTSIHLSIHPSIHPSIHTYIQIYISICTNSIVWWREKLQKVPSLRFCMLWGLGLLGLHRQFISQLPPTTNCMVPFTK